MTTLKDIEALTKTLADARAVLIGRAEDLRDQVQQVKRRRRVGILAATDQVNRARDDLRTALEENPGLFEKPRTRSLHNIKVGYLKGKAKVSFPDEPKTIKLIRKLLPEDQIGLLIRVRETVDKNAVADLTVADLKRLAIQVTPAKDSIVIKPTASDIDKFIDALLAEDDLDQADETGEQAA